MADANNVTSKDDFSHWCQHQLQRVLNMWHRRTTLPTRHPAGARLAHQAAAARSWQRQGLRVVEEFSSSGQLRVAGDLASARCDKRRSRPRVSTHRGRGGQRKSGGRRGLRRSTRLRRHSLPGRQRSRATCIMDSEGIAASHIPACGPD